jgi:hypothetical protein
MPGLPKKATQQLGLPFDMHAQWRAFGSPHRRVLFADRRGRMLRMIPLRISHQTGARNLDDARVGEELLEVAAHRRAAVGAAGVPRLISRTALRAERIVAVGRLREITWHQYLA